MPDKPTFSPFTVSDIPSHATSPVDTTVAIVVELLTEKQFKKLDLQNKMIECIKEYSGEGNIPINHDYWNWLNQYRG